jgi:F-type H+-transporting ATPase subunit gamma
LATAREIKRRIRSIKNIAQVTRAMQMVAAAKMRRAQEQVLATRAYAEKAWQILTHLAAQPGVSAEMHPLFQHHPSVDTVGLLLITSDKGLCGGYNANIIRIASRFVLEAGRPVKLVTVGRKGRNYMMRYGRDVVAEFTELPARPSLLDITPIARTALDGFLRREMDEVYLAYTDFVNTLIQRPVVRRLLPLVATEMESALASAFAPVVTGGRGRQMEITKLKANYIYEPDPRAILDTVLPRFTELQVYHAVLEALASEHSARMVAMRNATDSANDLLADLTLSYNQARQAAITKEMLDIAGGAEALAQARSWS